ncbi:hypothetical protein Q9L58_010314 [Maublancomyces gigas]|uniref:Uncharacterized protein n=1 Tax=Discina gigas TaxID=1032678 RepID=A0ABR3G4T9_9PEZI
MMKNCSTAALIVIPAIMDKSHQGQVPSKLRALISDANRYGTRRKRQSAGLRAPLLHLDSAGATVYPQDKAKVESAVQIVERGIMAQLHQQFTSVHAANVAMAPLRARLNEKLFQLLRGSRTSAFAAVDVERNCYNVPHALVGKVLEAQVTAAMVELLRRGSRVASNAGTSRVGGITTVARPDHGYRSSRKLLSLAKLYGKLRLRAACMLALQLSDCLHRHVNAILKNDRDQITPT